jgi:hypothetical protein
MSVYRHSSLWIDILHALPVTLHCLSKYLSVVWYKKNYPTFHLFWAEMVVWSDDMTLVKIVELCSIGEGSQFRNLHTRNRSLFGRYKTASMAWMIPLKEMLALPNVPTV